MPQLMSLRLLPSRPLARSRSRSPCLRLVAASAPASPAQTVSTETESSAASPSSGGIRVRFAPSPTGNLHVGGARTALFNYLFAQANNGQMILRVEDTDQARSTAASEAAVLRDLSWLGIHWDEGPDVGGSYGPYRQSERGDIYRSYLNKLADIGRAYPCFCTDEELEAMRTEAEEKGLPPLYSGKWASQDPEVVQEAAERVAKGEPHAWRFRVPKDQNIALPDAVRGAVQWDTNTLGDFVLVRSSGIPVYNFCAAIDDAVMQISHVIRAEEHLPNTLKQLLIYEALDFPPPTFAHCSLILAPDRSKLSKRHGATSVGQFAELGVLPEAMFNFLTLLGWNDGTEQEIFDRAELGSKFSLDRVSKSPAVFDLQKMKWMNSQHMKKMDASLLHDTIVAEWAKADLLSPASSTHEQLSDKERECTTMVVEMIKDSLETTAGAVEELKLILSYPLEETVEKVSAIDQGAEDDGGALVAKEWIDSGAVATLGKLLVEGERSGELQEAIAAGEWKKWTKAAGKAAGAKGKGLFMPLRIALTGRTAGPDLGALVKALQSVEESHVFSASAGFVSLSQRMERLDKWINTQ